MQEKIDQLCKDFIEARRSVSSTYTKNNKKAMKQLNTIIDKCSDYIEELKIAKANCKPDSTSTILQIKKWTSRLYSIRSNARNIVNDVELNGVIETSL